MNKSPHSLIKRSNASLFDRVVSILEEAQSNVVRAVNNNMVIAYWLIGREIVQEIQGGKGRAKYGEKIIEQLSSQLKEKYGRGFSISNLRYFRTFYTVYFNRKPEIRQIGSGELVKSSEVRILNGVLNDMSLAIETASDIRGFSPNLGWSHYQVIMNVENSNERLFYEIEAEKENWDVEYLKHQIYTFLFARLLKSKDKEGVITLTREGQRIKIPADVMKNPYILDFLGIPDSDRLHETKFEEAIISNLQSFLLELGKGFAFVGRQKRLQFDEDYYYVDMVFYNCILKCYLLIDLKIGALTHQDVGQIDSYVRMFDDKYRTEGDNPRFIFVKSDRDDIRHPKMLSLIHLAGEQLIRRRFNTMPELHSSIYASLVQYLLGSGRIHTGPFDATLCRNAEIADISEDKVRWFLSRAHNARDYALAETTPVVNVLIHLDLLDKGKPNHAAILLFGVKPQRFLITSEVKCMHFHGTQKLKPIPSYQIYKGTVFDLVDQLNRFF